MKALVLAAGYGTRLEKDIRSDTSGRFAHLLGLPKPLLPIGEPEMQTCGLAISASSPAVSHTSCRAAA